MDAVQIGGEVARIYRARLEVGASDCERTARAYLEPELRAERPIDPNVRIGQVPCVPPNHRQGARVLRRDPRLRRRARSPRQAGLGDDRGHSLRVGRAATTTTSGSTRGSRPTGRRSPTASRGCITSRSTSPRRRSSRRPSAASLTRGVPLRQLTDHGTHLAVYLSDPTATTSSSRGTGCSSSGGATARTTRRQTTAGSSSTSCSPIAGDAARRSRRGLRHTTAR